MQRRSRQGSPVPEKSSSTRSDSPRLALPGAASCPAIASPISLPGYIRFWCRSRRGSKPWRSHRSIPRIDLGATLPFISKLLAIRVIALEDTRQGNCHLRHSAGRQRLKANSCRLHEMSVAFLRLWLGWADEKPQDFLDSARRQARLAPAALRDFSDSGGSLLGEARAPAPQRVRVHQARGARSPRSPSRRWPTAGPAPAALADGATMSRPPSAPIPPAGHR